MYYVAGVPYSSELRHDGILGMHWYRRRFQNEDGSLTPAGRERYGVGEPRNEGTQDTQDKRRIAGTSLYFPNARYTHTGRPLVPMKTIVDASIKTSDQSFFGRGGTVDLYKRPVIPSKWLKDAGYDADENGTATVFSHSTSIGKNGDHAVTVTPILPNGDVLSKKTMDAILDNLYLGNDGKPHLSGKNWGFNLDDILISHYDVSDIPKSMRSQYINEVSNGLHQVQEALYDGIQPIEAPTDDISPIKVKRKKKKKTNSKPSTKNSADFVDAIGKAVQVAVALTSPAVAAGLTFLKGFFN